MYSKTPENELHKSKEPVNKKKTKHIDLLVICAEIPHNQIRVMWQTVIWIAIEFKDTPYKLIPHVFILNFLFPH